MSHFDPLKGVIAPALLERASKISALLRQLNIPHVLIL
jgi:hypothetical protein